jgi:acetoin utilization protein AcuB
MLQVRDSMTRNVVVLSPETTAAEALALCRERRIRHLPVLEDGRLVGIVSDRDLRSATPALGDPGRAAALEKIRVSDVMARDVTTAHPDDPIEVAANCMREARIGCLPVVEEDRLVGILTSSDVMTALVYLVGANEPGSRLEVLLPDRPGTLAGAAGVFRDHGVNVLSVAAAARHEETGREGPPEGPSGGRVAVFRIDTINPRAVVEGLEEAGYPVLWPPRS